jgi:hypothetical protein
MGIRTSFIWIMILSDVAIRYADSVKLSSHVVTNAETLCTEFWNFAQILHQRYMSAATDKTLVQWRKESRRISSFHNILILSYRRSVIYSSPVNIVAEWLTLLLRIREVSVSNLGSETGYPDWGLSWYFSVSPGEFRNSTIQLGYDRFLPNLFQSLILLSPYL